MRHCYVLRVFTRGAEGGNHLGVITDLTGLPEEAMQVIAADLGFSETVFIDWRSAGPPSVRIFTPATEMPFAGHPLVGAAWVLGVMGPGTVDRLVCEVGEIPFRVDGNRVWVDTPLVSDVEAADPAPAVAAGLPTTGRAWWARMPIPYLMVEAPSPAAVADTVPDLAVLRCGPAAEAVCLFARSGAGVRSRFFAPGLGVDEDPATGSAASAFAAVMAHEGEVEGRLTIEQGAEVGFPSEIHLEWRNGVASLGGSVVRDDVRSLEI
jgi:trans-2,3-dihydro-3-hydroxyanthranilate isomerase